MFLPVSICPFKACLLPNLTFYIVIRDTDHCSPWLNVPSHTEVLILNSSKKNWGEGDDRGWDGWRESLTQWTWIWVNSGSWWWAARPGVLWSMGSWRVGYDWATELTWRTDAFELWGWRRLLRVPWTARRSNKSILKEISPNIHWKDWCWSWNSNTLATWCKKLTHF